MYTLYELFFIPLRHQSVNVPYMNTLLNVWKITFAALGGMVGWVISEFRPTFPLVVITVIFILYDAWTAYKLDKRVHLSYPDRVNGKKAKFTSYMFGKVIRQTIPERLILIMLAYMLEHWVFIPVTIPLSYIATGAICFEQIWSILENESSCRAEEDSRLWKFLQNIMVDKTERHFDIDTSDITRRKKSEGRKPTK